MRQAINNLQSTYSGFGFVSGDNVFKVCDQPHPIAVQAIIRACLKGDIDGAMEKLNELWDQGYSAVDIVVTVFRVVKTFDESVFVLLIILHRLSRSIVESLNTQNWNTSKYVRVFKHISRADVVMI
jgi:DNA polymerase III delta prime subunit